MESRKIKGWRSRLQENIEVARREVQEVSGPKTVWVQESPDDREWEGTGAWGSGMFPKLKEGRGVLRERRRNEREIEERRARLKVLRDAVRALRDAERTPEELAAINARRRARYAAMSPEKHRAMLEKKREIYASLEPAEKQALIERLTHATRDWRQENPDLYRDQVSRYRAQNREAILAYKRAWNKAKYASDEEFRRKAKERARGKKSST